MHENLKEIMSELSINKQNIAILKEMRQFHETIQGISQVSTGMLKGIAITAGHFKNLQQQIILASESISYLKNSCAQNILNANLEISAVFSSLKPTKNVIEQLRTSQIEVTKILGTLSQITDTRILLSKEFSLITNSSILTQQVLSSNGFNKLFNTIGLTSGIGIIFKKDFISLTDSYKNYWNSFNSDIQTLLSLKPLIFKMPVTEMYLATRIMDFGVKTGTLKKESELTEAEVIKTITPKDHALNKLIGSVDIGLIKLYEGAKEATVSQGTDKVRHVAVSLRELLTHILNRLSPDEEILKWNSEPSNIVKGRPTRKARLLFICRNINHDSFTNFVDKDISSTLSFLDLLQEGTHAINTNYDDKQIESLVLRVESLLIFLINIAKIQ